MYQLFILQVISENGNPMVPWKSLTERRISLNCPKENMLLSKALRAHIAVALLSHQYVFNQQWFTFHCFSLTADNMCSYANVLMFLWSVYIVVKLRAHWDYLWPFVINSTVQFGQWGNWNRIIWDTALLLFLLPANCICANHLY